MTHDTEIGGWDFTDPMTPAEVAGQFRVGVHTVNRWGQVGKLAFISTPSGRRRYSRQQVAAIMRGEARS